MYESSLFFCSLSSILLLFLMTSCALSPDISSSPTVKISIFSIPGCAATPKTTSLVQHTAHEMGIAIDLDLVIAQTTEEAVHHRLIGSPTVRINGLDIEPESRSITHFGIT